MAGMREIANASAQKKDDFHKGKPPIQVNEGDRHNLRDGDGARANFPLSGIRVDVADDIAHGKQLLRFVVGHLDAELFLKCHDQLDGIEGISTKVLDEFCVNGDLLGTHAELLHNDILYTIFGTLV
jgi:hypothetical protein